MQMKDKSVNTKDKFMNTKDKSVHMKDKSVHMGESAQRYDMVTAVYKERKCTHQQDSFQ